MVPMHLRLGAALLPDRTKPETYFFDAKYLEGEQPHALDGRVPPPALLATDGLGVARDAGDVPGEPAAERPLRYCREIVSRNAPDASESTLLTMMR